MKVKRILKKCNRFKEELISVFLVNKYFKIYNKVNQINYLNLFLVSVLITMIVGKNCYNGYIRI